MYFMVDFLNFEVIKNFLNLQTLLISGAQPASQYLVKSCPLQSSEEVQIKYL